MSTSTELMNDGTEPVFHIVRRQFPTPDEWSLEITPVDILKKVFEKPLPEDGGVSSSLSASSSPASSFPTSIKLITPKTRKSSTPRASSSSATSVDSVYEYLTRALSTSQAIQDNDEEKQQQPQQDEPSIIYSPVEVSQQFMSDYFGEEN